MVQNAILVAFSPRVSIDERSCSCEEMLCRRICSLLRSAGEGPPCEFLLCGTCQYPHDEGPQSLILRSLVNYNSNSNRVGLLPRNRLPLFLIINRIPLSGSAQHKSCHLSVGRNTRILGKGAISVFRFQTVTAGRCLSSSCQSCSGQKFGRVRLELVAELFCPPPARSTK